MWFRNVTSSPLDFFNELGSTVGPGGEFDWPAYDPDVHGAVTGCEPIDDPGAKPKKRRRPSDDSGGDSGDRETGAPGQGDDGGQDNDETGDSAAAAGTSEEDPR